MKILQIFLIISLVILLSGCNLFGRTKPVDSLDRAVTVTKWQTYDCGLEPQRDAITYKEVLFVVTKNGTWVLDAQEYGDLGDNTAYTIDGAKQQALIIEHYRRCIIAANRKVTEKSNGN